MAKAAPAKKTVAPKAAPKAAAPAPAPAVEQAADEGVELQIGDNVRFLGYGEDVPAEDQTLTAGEVYPVVGFTEPDEAAQDPGGNPILSLPNPGYKPKVKEDPVKNPKNLEVEAFPEELELVEGEAAAEPAAEVVEAAAAPAPAAKTTRKTAAAPAAAAPAAVKGKGAVAAVAPKGKGKAAAPAPAPVEEVVEDELPDLEGEDADVLALLESEEGVIAVAQGLELRVGETEWQLGGLFYHIKKSGEYKEIIDEATNKPVERYSQDGGWTEFLKDYFNIEYRKAQYLIEIYQNFTLAGIENPAEVVARLGWTKASKIAKPLVEDGANTEELIELAETSTVKDLSTALMEQVEVGGTPGEKKKRLTVKFRFFEEEAASVNAILEQAKEQLSLKTLEDAFYQIVTEWSTAQAGGEATQAAAPVQTAAPKAKPALKPAVKRPAVRSAA